VSNLVLEYGDLCSLFNEPCIQMPHPTKRLSQRTRNGFPRLINWRFVVPMAREEGEGVGGSAILSSRIGELSPIGDCWKNCTTNKLRCNGNVLHDGVELLMITNREPKSLT
jgi:hypothetical protein